MKLFRSASRDAIDPQSAFRAGVMGWRLHMAADAEPRAGEGFGFGPNERLAVRTGRLPGLVDKRCAFEAGRAIRAISKLLDRVQAPATVGQQFLDNLAAACIAHSTRRLNGVQDPWGAEQTVEMFAEMYERILQPSEHELEIVRERLLAYAKDETAPLPGTAAARSAASKGRSD
jgi:hypothetical protein